jgi:transposase InsO family protein
MSVAQAAFMANVSRTTAYRVFNRFLREGMAGLEPRSRRPHRSPGALPSETVAAIIDARQTSGRGPLWISWKLGVACSTVHLILKRAGLNRLQTLDRVTRLPVRYEHERPGDLLHLDVKKLWRIPPGGGRRFELTPEGGERIPRAGKRGWGVEYLHVAIDDHSRYLYAELLPNYTARTTIAFVRRALADLQDHQVRVRRILTDNGANYRSKWFTQYARMRRVSLKHTRPYRPQTNGKAERVIQTLLREWAYQRRYLSNDERTSALWTFLHVYNTSRPHAALGRRAPISRLPV